MGQAATGDQKERGGERDSMTRKPTAQVIPDPSKPNTWHAIVTNIRGLRYFTVWGDKPTESEVLLAWKEVRREFKPYSEGKP